MNISSDIEFRLKGPEEIASRMREIRARIGGPPAKSVASTKAQSFAPDQLAPLPVPDFGEIASKKATESGLTGSIGELSSNPDSVVPLDPYASGLVVAQDPNITSLTRQAAGSGVRLDRLQIEGLVAQAAREQGLDNELVKAVVWAESDFNPLEVSHVGAKGLMQLMPETAKELGVEDSFDPVQNLRGGTMYLRQMLDRFDGNISLALAAYNAGPGAVQRHGGIPPFKETQNYVRKILARVEKSPMIRGEIG